jgi:hypothetical protein
LLCTWEALVPVTPIQQRLASLQAHYAARIDAAVAAGRMDLVRDLANGYEDEALELILDGDDGTSTRQDHGTVEFLEFDGGWPHWHRPGTWRFGFWRHRGTGSGTH